jgi:GNAT superfamily N-acetyltransferase
VPMRLRELDPALDRAALVRLWRSALAPAWPLLPGALDLVQTGLVAEAGAEVVGAVASDRRGSLLLLMVDPARRRQGVGSALHAAALARLREAGAGEVGLGSGGANYVWPGVPLDLPDAVRFFAARGWTWDGPVSDLTADLRAYEPPPGVLERAAAAGVSFSVARPEEVAEALRFEERWFPEWVLWFGQPEVSVLLARDGQGTIVGSLLLAGPGRCSIYWPMLGDDMATIGCVGVAGTVRRSGIGGAMVARASQLLSQAGARNCHIGWVGLQVFYEQLGYRRWRDYGMARRSLKHSPPASEEPT